MQVRCHKNNPVSGGGWAGFLQNSALSLAVLLLASAVICWVAANWAQASVFQKLAGVQAVLVALVLVAWRLVYVPGAGKSQNFAAAANITGLAAVVAGVLLALVGQIYQTGADPWQLFLLWAVLLIPWLLAIRTVFLALLGVALLNLTAGLYLDIQAGVLWGGASWASISMFMVVLNLALLALWEYSIALLDDRWRIWPRLVGAGALSWVVAAALAGLDAHDGGLYLAVLGLMVCALGYWVYSRRRYDLALVSLIVLTAFCLVTIILISWIDDEMGLLLIIMALVALAGAMLRHLLGLIRQAPPGSKTEGEPVHDRQEPWYFSVARLVMMGITACLVIVFPFISMELAIEQVWQAGVVLGAIGLIVFRAGRGAILREMGLTLMAAGMLMLAGGLLVTSNAQPDVRVLVLLAVAVVLYVFAASPAFRFLCAFLAIVAGVVLTWSSAGRDEVFFFLNESSNAGWWQVYLRLWGLAVAAILAWLLGSRRPGPAFWTPLGWALVCSAQIMAWLAPAPAVFGWPDMPPALMLLWLACAALPVVVLGGLLWSQRGLSIKVRIGASLALAVASVGWMGAPGIALALVWLILGHALRRRTLLAFGVLALLSYLWRFYYLMDSTLLQKSWVLGLTGAWLLLSWLVLRKLAGGSVQQSGLSDGSRQDRHAWQVAGLLGGLVLIMLVVNTGIYQREQILATGQRVVLALAPVDPRSLMQGDYMALRFEAANQLGALLARAPGDLAEQARAQQAGYLVLQPDAQGVHRAVAVLANYAGQKQEGVMPGQVVLEFRLRHRETKIVTNAWFFPEGQADVFERARYGEFRVDGKGTGLLVRMLDDGQRVLP